MRIEDADFGSSIGVRGIRIDLLVTAVDKSTYSIEIQLLKDKYMLSRNWHYLSRIISRQLNTGDNFAKLDSISMINIMNFNLFAEAVAKSFYNTASLMLEGHKDVMVSDEVAFYFVELPKFAKTEKDRANPLHIWLEYFISGYKNQAERKELLTMNKDIAAFDDAYNRMLGDDDAWIQYEFERRSIEAFHSEMLTAYEDGAEMGMVKGEEKGMKIGIEKGMEIGAAKSKEAVAVNLIRMGLSIDQVAACTGLSIERVKELT